MRWSAGLPNLIEFGLLRRYYYGMRTTRIDGGEVRAGPWKRLSCACGYRLPRRFLKWCTCGVWRQVALLG